MKGIFQRIQASLILAASLLMLAACSSKEDTPGNGGTHELPTFKDINVEKGQQGFIEFDAYGTWTLSSNKPSWFRLKTSTGKAGSQKVEYTVTDDEIGFENDVATITLTMVDDQKTVEFKATRIPTERKITFYKFDPVMFEWNETEELHMEAIEGAFRTGFKVVANFKWKLEVPEWVKIDLDHTSGEPNIGVELKDIPTSWIDVDYKTASTENMTGKLVFADFKDPEAFVEVNTSCIGTKYHMLSTALYSARFNAIGQYLPDGYPPVADYSFEITAPHQSNRPALKLFNIPKKNLKYGVELGDGTINYEVATCKITASSNSTELGPNVRAFKYTAKCSENADYTYSSTALLIPTVLLKEHNIVGAADLLTADRTALKPEFEPYILFEMVQAGQMRDISFSTGTAPEGISLEKLESGAEYDQAKSKYNVDLIYVITFDSFAQVNYSPLDFSGYQGDRLEPMYDPAEIELKGGKGWIKFEANLSVQMAFTFSKEFSSPRNGWIIGQDIKTVDGNEVITNEFAIKVVQNTKYVEPSSN